MKKIIFIITLGLCQVTFGDVTSSGSTTNTQSNNAGSNTAITGGYESSTTYQSGSSSNTTTTNSTNNNSNQKTATNTASAPSMSVYGQDSCVIPLSMGITTIGVSLSTGNYYIDEECSMRKKVKLLSFLGMKVASISLLCQDDSVWKAMMNAGTPCPINGLIGDKAKKEWQKIKGVKRFTNKKSMTWND
tara:strand:+ start:809 stop:1375 length:567 start_codon:yes stop_codon:yes gene_type:complete